MQAHQTYAAQAALRAAAPVAARVAPTFPTSSTSWWLLAFVFTAVAVVGVIFGWLLVQAATANETTPVSNHADR